MDNIPLFVYTAFCLLIYSLMGIWVVSIFCLLWLMLLWTLLYIYIVKPLLSFVYKPRSKIMGSYGNSMLNSLKNCHTIFHSSHSMLCFHQQCTKVPVYLYARQCLFSVFMISHFIGCEVSHCEVDLHFPNYLWCWASFLWLLAIHTSSLEKCLFKSFAQ